MTTASSISLADGFSRGLVPLSFRTYSGTCPDSFSGTFPASFRLAPASPPRLHSGGSALISQTCFQTFASAAFLSLLIKFPKEQKASLESQTLRPTHPSTLWLTAADSCSLNTGPVGGALLSAGNANVSKDQTCKTVKLVPVVG